MTRVIRSAVSVLLVSSFAWAANSATSSEASGKTAVPVAVSSSSTLITPSLTNTGAGEIPVVRIPSFDTPIEPIRVIASRPASAIEKVPSMVTVIDARAASRAGGSVKAGSAVVDSGAGAFRGRYPGALDMVTIRGYADTGEADKSRVAVLLDGRPAGGANLAKMPIDGLERVEVVRGSGAALFGTSAMGGVVNMVPRRGKGAPAGIFAVESGSWDHRRVRADYGGKSGPADYFVSADRLTSGAYRVPGSGLEQNGGVSEWSGLFNVGVEPVRGHRIGVSGYGYFGDRLNDPGSFSWPADPKQYYFKRHETGQVSLTGSLGALSWDQAVWESREIDTSHEYSMGPESVSNFEGWEQGGKHLFDVDLSGMGTVTTGVEWSNRRSENFNYTDVPFSPRSHRLGYAWLAEARVAPIRMVELTGGVRKDWFSQDAGQPTRGKPIPGVDSQIREWSALTGHGGVVVDLSPARVYASAGTGFRAPVAYELAADYTTSFFGWPYTYKGDPNLKPEKSVMGEAGIGLAGDIFSGSVGYFHTVFRNKIKEVLISGTDYKYKNLSGTTLAGVEMDAAVVLHNSGGALVKPFVSGTYHTTFRNNDSEEVEKNGFHDLTYLPRWFGSAGVGVEKDAERRGGWSGRVRVTANGQEKQYDFATLGWVSRKPFAVWGADARYRLDDGMTLFGSVENLMNERIEYTLDYPMAATSVVFGLEARI